jgi:hypothetical protein
MSAGMNKQIQGRDGVHMVHAEVAQMVYNLQQDVMRLGKENSALKEKLTSLSPEASNKHELSKAESNKEMPNGSDGEERE